MSKTSTICLTILGALAIAGVVICGLAGVTATASALTAIAVACASGIIGYTIGKATPPPTDSTTGVI